MSRMLTIVCVAVLAISAAAADELYLSVASNIDNELAGVTFLDGDIIKTNSAGSVASIFAPETTFGTGPDIDAFHILPNGNYLISALFNDININSVTYLDGDVVEYNPNTGDASLYFSEALLGGTSPDISAVTINNAGLMVFSTLADSSLAGTAFTDGDIVQWNPGANTASILVSEAQIFDDGDGDVYGLHYLPNGHYLISASDNEVVSGVSFRDGDIFDYDPVNDTASLVFSEDYFGGPNDDDIDALYYVPEPTSLALLGLALVALRRR